MKIAALQMVSTPRVDDNLARAAALVAEAARAGAELAVLPEYFCLIGHADTDKLAHAEADGRGPIQAALAHMAREHRVWVIGGTLPMAIDGDAAHATNTTLVFAPDGTRAARYDKIHLFRYHDGERQYDEAATLAPGRRPVTTTLRDRADGDWRVGLSVCYDLRFPELYRRLAQPPADLLVVPAAFTHTTGQAHWEILLRARAIENQCYVLAAAQGGQHENGRRTWGHSMVIDPWGGVMAQRETGEGVVVAEMQRALLDKVRQQLPALDHRVF